MSSEPFENSPYIAAACPDENIDEKIAAQQSQIEKQIAEEQPLISQKYDLTVLLNEYLEDDIIYRQKITELYKQFKFIRKTRGDGNCFFRAFGFAYLESIMGDKEKIEALRAKAIQYATDLTNLGYLAFTIDDFKDVFLEVLDKLLDPLTTSQTLEHTIFNDPGTSDYIVVYLRLMVSCYLQTNSDFYMNFVSQEYATMKDFCSKEVEPMYRESDHIHVIALTNALDVPLSIVYLDRTTEQDKAIQHNFPEDGKPVVFILYRPGHYDIISSV